MEKKNRRKFIEKGAATVAAAALGLPAMASKTGPSAAGASKQAEANDSNRPPIVHHVFFWLKNPASTEDREKLVAGLKTLAGIPLIKELYVGVLANTEKRDVVDASWQVSELMFFVDLSAQANYQQHPLHLAFVKNCSPLWEKVVVYDAMNLFNRIG
jgi:Stress responsive A/B Barrel Domain